MEERLLLSARSVRKAFGPTRALVDVDLDLHRGEIRGLIGENGSGKSTLASILAGVQPADCGTFLMKGQPYQPANMVEAQNRGVSMIIQEMGTIPGITVAANVFAGRLEQHTRLGFVDFGTMNRRTADILKDIGAEGIEPDMPIGCLDFESRKIVEIARAMSTQPELLIIDETTTALAHRGRTILYNLIRRLHDRDKAILFISHDLQELMDICNAITVLRDGQVVGTLGKDRIDIPTMRRLMVGRELTGSYYRADFGGRLSDGIVLEAKQVTGRRLMNVDLQLHKGEILGIGGLADCGMHELGRILFGIDRPVRGRVTLRKTGRVIRNPVVAVRNRMAYVSKERDREAIILNAAVGENIVLPSLSGLGGRLGFISRRAEKKLAERQISLLRIRCRNSRQHCSELSGGNKQKVVFSKWLAKESDILILDCPTRGIDIGVKAAMYQLMAELKTQGKSIIMISEELLELIGMSDRILVMRDGAIQAEIHRRPGLSEQDIIHHLI